LITFFQKGQQTSTFVVIGDSSGLISIYDSSSSSSPTSSLSFVKSFQGHSGYIQKIKQSPFNNTSHLVATCSSDFTVKVWDAASDWTLIRTYSNHSSEVESIAWLDEDTLASSGWTDEKIKIWSVRTGQTKLTIDAWNGDIVDSLEMLSDKIHLAHGSGWV
jgi:WD40 repeat protein